MNSQDKMYPLVSVVVPAYNAETRIAYSLKSIIAQDYPNIEIIVVNDASTDATEQAARSVLEGCGRPFTIITHKKNSGETASRNTGRRVLPRRRHHSRQDQRQDNLSHQQKSGEDG